MLSTDARVALAPEAMYRQLVLENVPGGWGRALVRPALVLLVIAVILPIMATHAITARLVLTFAAAWSIVVAIQSANGIAMIASAPARRVSVARAFDLWFAGHLPYNVWVLLLPLTAFVASERSLEAMALTFAAPLMWSAFITAAFCRIVLGTSARAARQRAIVHLLVTFAVTLTLVLWAAGGMSAVASYLHRLQGRS